MSEAQARELVDFIVRTLDTIGKLVAALVIAIGIYVIGWVN